MGDLGLGLEAKTVAVRNDRTPGALTEVAFDAWFGAAVVKNQGRKPVLDSNSLRVAVEAAVNASFEAAVVKVRAGKPVLVFQIAVPCNVVPSQNGAAIRDDRKNKSAWRSLRDSRCWDTLLIKKGILFDS
jgi:hypothetical protein